VELLKYSSEENTPSGGRILPKVIVNQTDMFSTEDTEDWEAELVAGSYDPSRAAAKANVLRKIEGATPSQRKEFRITERDRLERLASGLSIDDLEDLDRTSANSGPTSQPRSDRHFVPLRKPSQMLNSTSRYSGSTPTLMQVHRGRGKLDTQECQRPGPVDHSPADKDKNANWRPMGRGGTNLNMPNIGRGRGLQILCLKDGSMRKC